MAPSVGFPVAGHLLPRNPPRRFGATGRPPAERGYRGRQDGRHRGGDGLVAHRPRHSAVRHPVPQPDRAGPLGDRLCERTGVRGPGFDPARFDYQPGRLRPHHFGQRPARRMGEPAGFDGHFGQHPPVLRQQQNRASQLGPPAQRRTFRPVQRRSPQLPRPGMGQHFANPAGAHHSAGGHHRHPRPGGRRTAGQQNDLRISHPRRAGRPAGENPGGVSAEHRHRGTHLHRPQHRGNPPGGGNRLGGGGTQRHQCRAVGDRRQADAPADADRPPPPERAGTAGKRPLPADPVRGGG